jgi:mannosyl-oligosaccharide glucosidase
LDSNTFAWKGRTVGHCLASGFDDFPRAETVNSQEGHVDLQSWMAMMSRELANIAYLLGNQEDANYFSIFEQEYLAVLKRK